MWAGIGHLISMKVPRTSGCTCRKGLHVPQGCWGVCTAGNKHQPWGRCIYVVRWPLTGTGSFILPPSTKETSPLFFSKINWYWTPTDCQQKIPQLLYNLCGTTHSNAKFSGVSSSLHCVQEFTTAIILFEIKTLLAFTFFHVHCMQQPTRNGSFLYSTARSKSFQ